LRARRRDLPDHTRHAADAAIRRALDRLRVWRPGQRVAVFLGMPDEVDLRPCLIEAWRRDVRIYVPRILDLRRGEMAFIPYDPLATLRRNEFGIDEPVVPIGRRVGALQLDTVLVPLVGFDALGARLGMGAGFYDRALRRRLDPGSAFRRPRLVGVAYAVQEVDRIDTQAWDVPLDAVVTEHGARDFRRHTTD
jgi:5-formyltetrahydrofolate cyclo-ligase